MARIQVKFDVQGKTSAAGNLYYLIEMRTTDANTGQFRELPDVKLTPFTARLLLEHLPEFCKAIEEGERQKAGGVAAPAAQAPAEAALVPQGGGEVVAPQQTTGQHLGGVQQPAGDDCPF